MCQSEAEAATCFARFCACKSFVLAYGVGGSILYNLMKRRISSARASVKVLQSFSSKVYTGGRSPLVLVVLVRISPHLQAQREPAGGFLVWPEPAHLLV
jgi:hypothetical protein